MRLTSSSSPSRCSRASRPHPSPCPPPAAARQRCTFSLWPPAG